MASSSSTTTHAERPRSDTGHENLPPVVTCSPDLWLSDGTIVLRTTDYVANAQTLFRVHKSTLGLHSSFFHDLSSTDHENPPPVVTHSPDLWLSDGTIILRTTDPVANAQTLFRVHKSTLGLHSSFFHDLFDGPQTAFDTASESYVGLPVMDMMDDASDVAEFLKAMYFPRYMQRHNGSTINDLDRSNFPGMYEGILRLAQKYDAQELREIVVEGVRREWPTTLKRWNAKRLILDINAELVEDQPLDDEDSWLLSYEVYPNPAQAIRLAVQFDIPDILPVAFYNLACIFMDRSRDSDLKDQEVMLDGLSSPELRRLVLGTAALRAEVRTVDHFLYPAHGFCSGSDGACQDTIAAWCKTALLSMYESSDLLEWLRLQEKDMDFTKLHHVCGPCSERTKKTLRARAGAIWVKLPSLFGLARLFLRVCHDIPVLTLLVRMTLSTRTGDITNG
ncbi:hypothetical protein OF83DRAFT_1285097 [Amylostereum chailletii]|nr:hypothetical protein OF83DRAFT_1285097 [Amylostereum chailletii]